MIGSHGVQSQDIAIVPEIRGILLEPLDGHRSWIRCDIASNGHCIALLSLPGLRLNHHHGRVQDVQDEFLLSSLAKTIVRNAGVLAGVLDTHPMDRVN